jgi:hypothetical protein
LACNLPSTDGPVDQQPQQEDGVSQVQPETPTSTPSPPEIVVNTPEPTATITYTPTITPTFTASVPLVSVSVDTNCRFGPAAIYDWLGAILVGEIAEIVGKNYENTHLYIVNPDRPGEFCWITKQYANVEGELLSVPVLTPEPTPTPLLGKIVAFVWQDQNANGAVDGGESGISGAPVELRKGACGSGSSYLTVNTDGSGYATFTGIAAGTYCLRVDKNSIPGGNWDSTTTPYSTIELLPGDTDDDAFGFEQL